MRTIRALVTGSTAVLLALLVGMGSSCCSRDERSDGVESDNDGEGGMSVDEWMSLSTAVPTCATQRERRRLQQEGSRRAPHEFGIRAPEFRRSEQNSGIWKAECKPWDRSLENRNQTAVIEENTCFRLDLKDDEVIFPQGLDIRGRLLVDDIPRGLTIQTKFIIVQGVLSIYNKANHTIGPTAHEHRLKILFIGSDDVFLIPNSQNQRMCPRPNVSCNIGSKPMVVAGGQLDIHAMPTPTCPSWVHPLSATSFMPPLKTEQQNHGTVEPCDIFIDTDFNNGTAQGWTTRESGTPRIVDNSYLEFSDRQPFDELRFQLDRTCYDRNKNQPYLFQATVRLTGSSAADATPLACSFNGTSCLRLSLTSDEPTTPSQTLAEYGPGLVQLDRWFDIHAVITFSDFDDFFEFPNVVFFTVGTSIESSLTVALANVVLRRLPMPSDISTCATNDLFGKPPALSSSLKTTSHPYPFLGEDNYLLRPIRFRRDDFGGSFLAIENRLRKSDGTSVELPTSGGGCIMPGSTYRLDFQFRLQSSETRLRIYLRRSMGDTFGQHTVKHCGLGPIDSREEWKTCFAVITFSSQLLHLWDKLWIGLDTRDDETDSIGDIHLSDLQFRLVRGPMEHIVLPPTVLNCWDAGAELLITSSSSSYKSSQLVSIRRVEEDENGNALVTFSDSVAIAAPRTLADSPDFPVEVALLSRNVIMEGDDQNDEQRGGHMMFYFTREKQHMEGVELRYFGQQGTKSRYPIHTHISGNMKGSIISKNVIRDSYQRCIVLQATYNLKVAENVAFRTRGHCFVVEEGGEFGNEFVGNLGASTLPVQWSISNDASNETETATFWSSAPYNSWERNVAAGGVHTGFSIRSSSSVRGESAVMYQGWNPSIVPLKSFSDNVAHSNGEHGVRVFQFYPRDRRGELINTKSYRNVMTGLYIQDGENLKISGGVFADNHIQVRLGRADDIILDDGLEMAGVTEEARTELERSLVQEYSKCAADTGVVGLYVTTFSQRIELSNTNFRFFRGGGCGPPASLFLDSRQDGDEKVQSPSFIKIRNLGFDPAPFPPGVGCFESEGIRNVFVEDTDGSLNGGIPGFFVGSNDTIIGFLSGDCSSTPSPCFQSCPKACLGTLRILLDQNDAALRISTDEAETVLRPQVFDVNQTVIKAVLPAPGHYRFTFVDDNDSGSVVFPKFEVADPQDSAECRAENDLTFDISAPPFCRELVKNGDFEKRRVDFWKPLFEGPSYKVHRMRGGQNSSFAMATDNQDKMGHHLEGVGSLDFVSLTIGYDLDTTVGCLLVGTTYEVEAFVKVLGADGNAARCGEGRFGCAFAHIKYDFEEEKRIGDRVGATTARKTPGGWRHLYGIFRVKKTIRRGSGAFFYIRGAATVLAPSVLVADNISIHPIDINAGPWILNGDFEVGDSRFWNSQHRRELKGEFERIAMASPGSNGSEYALQTVGRSETSDGLRHELQGDRRFGLDTSYVFTAHFRLNDATDKSVSCPETVACPRVIVVSRERDEKAISTSVTEDDSIGDGWKQLRAGFSIDENDERSFLNPQVSIVVSGVDARLDILLDEVSLVVND